MPETAADYDVRIREHLAAEGRLPLLQGRFRGTCMALWDDFLPPVPQEVIDANARFVVERLTSTHGGMPRG